MRGQIMKSFLQMMRSLVSHTQESDAQEETSPADLRPKLVERQTVLIIDDDAEFLKGTRALLCEVGMNVLTSHTGPKGLDLLRYTPGGVRVVLLDFHMPHFDGAQTLPYIRRLAPAAKIVGISGYDTNRVPPAFQ